MHSIGVSLKWEVQNQQQKKQTEDQNNKKPNPIQEGLCHTMYIYSVFPSTIFTWILQFAQEH